MPGMAHAVRTWGTPFARQACAWRGRKAKSRGLAVVGQARGKIKNKQDARAAGGRLTARKNLQRASPHGCRLVYRR